MFMGNFIVKSNGQDVTDEIIINGNDLIFPENQTEEIKKYQVSYKENETIVMASNEISVGVCKCEFGVLTPETSCIKKDESISVTVKSIDRYGKYIMPSYSLDREDLVQVVGINNIGDGQFEISLRCLNEGDEEAMCILSINGGCENETLYYEIPVCKREPEPEPTIEKDIIIKGVIYSGGTNYGNYAQRYFQKVKSSIAIPSGLRITCKLATLNNSYGKDSPVADGNSNPCTISCSPRSSLNEELVLSYGDTESLTWQVYGDNNKQCGCRYEADYPHYFGACYSFTVQEDGKNPKSYNTNRNAARDGEERKMTSVTIGNVTYNIWLSCREIPQRD